MFCPSSRLVQWALRQGEEEEEKRREPNKSMKRNEEGHGRSNIPAWVQGGSNPRSGIRSIYTCCINRGFRIGGRTAAVWAQQISSRRVIGLLPPRLYCNTTATPQYFHDCEGKPKRSVPLVRVRPPLSLFPSFPLTVPVAPETVPRNSSTADRNLVAISLCQDLRADNHRRDVPAFFGQIIIIYIALPRGQRSNVLPDIN